MIKEVGLTLEAAERKLRAAELLLTAGELGDAASRTYYAVFHAISAVHLAHGETFSSHAQLIGTFNKEYVRTGKFPKRFTKIITRLFEDRQAGDYSILSNLTETEVSQDVEDAKHIVASIKEFLATGEHES